MSDALTDNWNPYVEVFWFSRQSIAGGSAASLDAGAIYQIGTRYALDGGVQFGLTRDAPAVAAFGGVSVLVGDVLGSHGAVARQRSAERRMRARPATNENLKRPPYDGLACGGRRGVAELN